MPAASRNPAVLDDISAAQQYALDLQVLFYSLKTVAANAAKEAAAQAAGPHPTRGAAPASPGDEASSRSSAQAKRAAASNTSVSTGPDGGSVAALQRRIEDLTMQLEQERREREQLQHKFDEVSTMLKKSYGQIVDDYLFATEQLHERTRQLERIMGASASDAPDAVEAQRLAPEHDLVLPPEQPSPPAPTVAAPELSKPGLDAGAAQPSTRAVERDGGVPAAASPHGDSMAAYQTSGSNAGAGALPDGLAPSTSSGVGDADASVSQPTWLSSRVSEGSRSASSPGTRAAGVPGSATTSNSMPSWRASMADPSSMASQAQSESERRSRVPLQGSCLPAASGVGSAAVPETSAFYTASDTSAHAVPSRQEESATGVGRVKLRWELGHQGRESLLQQQSATATAAELEQRHGGAKTAAAEGGPRRRAHVAQSAVDSPPACAPVSPVRPSGSRPSAAGAPPPLPDPPSSPYCYDSPLVPSMLGADSEASTPPPHYPPSATSACSLLSELAPYLSVDALRQPRRAENIADLPTRLFTSASSPPPTTDFAPTRPERGSVLGIRTGGCSADGTAAASAAKAPQPKAWSQEAAAASSHAAGLGGAPSQRRGTRDGKECRAGEEQAAAARGAQAAARAAAARLGASVPGPSLPERLSASTATAAESDPRRRRQGHHGGKAEPETAPDELPNPAHGNRGPHDSHSGRTEPGRRSRRSSVHRLRPPPAGVSVEPASSAEPGMPAAATAAAAASCTPSSPGVKRPRRSDGSPGKPRSPGRAGKGEPSEADGERGTPAKRGASGLRRSSSGCAPQPVPPSDPPSAYRPRAGMAAERLAAGASGAAGPGLAPAVGAASSDGPDRGPRHALPTPSAAAERAGHAALPSWLSDGAGNGPGPAPAAASSHKAAAAAVRAPGASSLRLRPADRDPAVEGAGGGGADWWAAAESVCMPAASSGGSREHEAPVVSRAPGSASSAHSSGRAGQGHDPGDHVRTPTELDMDMDALFRMAKAALQRGSETAARKAGPSGPDEARQGSWQHRGADIGGGLRGAAAATGGTTGYSPAPETPLATAPGSGGAHSPAAAAGEAPRSAGASTTCSSSSLEGLASLVRGLRQRLAGMQHEYEADVGEADWHTDDDGGGSGGAGYGADANGHGADGSGSGGGGGYSSGEDGNDVDGELDVEELLARTYGGAEASGRSGGRGDGIAEAHAPSRTRRQPHGWESRLTREAEAIHAETEAVEEEEEPAGLRELRNFFRDYADPHDSAGGGGSSGNSSNTGSPWRGSRSEWASCRHEDVDAGMRRAADRSQHRTADGYGAGLAAPAAAAQAGQQQTAARGARTRSPALRPDGVPLGVSPPAAQPLIDPADGNGELRSPPAASFAAPAKAPASARCAAAAAAAGSQARGGGGLSSDWSTGTATHHDRAAPPDQTSPRKASAGSYGHTDLRSTGSWKGTEPFATTSTKASAAAGVAGSRRPVASTASASRHAGLGGRGSYSDAGANRNAAAGGGAPVFSAAGDFQGVRGQSVPASNASHCGGAASATDSPGAEAADLQGLRSEAMFARIRQQLDDLQSSFAQGLGFTPGSGGNRGGAGSVSGARLDPGMEWRYAA